jgi:hypothetical protein
MARGLQDQKEKLLELQTLLYFLSDTPESGPIDDNEAKIRSCIDQCSSQITTKEIEFIVEADSAKSHCFSLFSYENILLPQLFRAVLKACISKASIKVRFTGQPEESLAISFPADPSMVDVISDMFRIPDNEEEFWHGWHEILVARLVAEESGFDLWLEVMGQDVVVIHLVEKSKA